MLLEGKNAVIYGAGGAIGGARAFAREGARVFLAGRTLAKVEAVAEEISAAGGTAEAARVDALDEQAIDELPLMVFPTVVGSGKRLFEDGLEETVLRLVDTTTFGSGVIVLTYRPARDEGEDG